MVLGSRDGCPLMPMMQEDLEKLGQAMSHAVTGMQDQWTSSLGANSIPRVLEEMTRQHANQDFDGAQTIAQATAGELNNFYFTDGLWQQFGARTWFIQITDHDFDTNEVISASRTSAFKTAYGYNILFDIMDKDTVFLSDDDCRDGDANDQIECMRSKLGDDVGMSVYDRLNDATRNTAHFSYTYYAGALYHKYCCDDDYDGFDLRVVDSAADTLLATSEGEIHPKSGWSFVSVGKGKNETSKQRRESDQELRREGDYSQ